MVVHDGDARGGALVDERGVDVDLVGAERVHAGVHAHARVAPAVDLDVLGVRRVLRARRDRQLRALRLDLQLC